MGRDPGLPAARIGHPLGGRRPGWRTLAIAVAVGAGAAVAARSIVVLAIVGAAAFVAGGTFLFWRGLDQVEAGRRVPALPLGDREYPLRPSVEASLLGVGAVGVGVIAVLFRADWLIVIVCGVVTATVLVASVGALVLRQRVVIAATDHAATVAVVLVAFWAAGACGGSDRPDPLAVALAEIKSMCGDAYREHEEHQGCRTDVSHGAWSGAADLALNGAGRPRGLWIKISGRSVDVAELRRRARAIIAPLIDRDAEELVAQALERVFRDGGGEFGARTASFEIGPASVTAFTGVNIEEPWRRTIRIAAYFVGRGRELVPRVPPDEFMSSLGKVNDHVLATWRRLCLDDAELGQMLGFRVAAPPPSGPDPLAPADRWNEGDIWMRCALRSASGAAQPSALVDVTWAPTTRRVVRVRIVVDGGADGALARLADVIITPIASPEQRKCVLEQSPHTIDGCDALGATWEHNGAEVMEVHVP